MRSRIKHTVIAVVAIIVLMVLRVEAEVRFGVDLYYVWLAVSSAIIGILLSSFWLRSSNSE